jgi:hypothetical protein
MDLQGNDVTKVIDGVEPQEELNLLYANENTLIAIGGYHRVVYNYDMRDKVLKTYPIKGVPFSVSEDYVLFNKADDTDTLVSDISVLDLHSGVINQIGHPVGYQVVKGAWSPDNKAFAFYSQETVGVKTELFLLDLESFSEIQVENNKAVGTLNPLGAISWINDHSVIVDSEDQVTWKAFIR